MPVGPRGPAGIVLSRVAAPRPVSPGSCREWRRSPLSPRPHKGSRSAPVGPAGLPGAARAVRTGAEPAGISIRTLYRWRAAYRRRGFGRSRGVRTGRPEAGVAGGGDGGDPSPSDGAPNLGKRKIRPLLLRFCERRGLRCVAVVTIGRLIADAGGLRAVPPRRDNRGRRKRPATREAAQAKGLPGATPRGGAGGGHRDRGARQGCVATCSPASTCQPVRPTGGPRRGCPPAGPGTSPTSPSTCSPGRWTGCSPTTARSRRAGSPSC